MSNTILWTGSNNEEIDNFIGIANSPQKSKHAFLEDKVIIKTKTGNKQVDPGDHIAKDNEGNLYIV